MIGILQDAVRRFPAVRWVAKMDDDSVFLVPHMIRELEGACPGATPCPLYWGCVNAERGVVNPTGKWSAADWISHSKLDRYPPYMFGAGYVLSGDVAAQLVAMHGLGLVTFAVESFRAPLRERSLHAPIRGRSS